jgi:SAM-dependent methyltransferase
MSIVEHISSEDKEKINALLKKYSTNNEFEVSLFSTNETGSEFLTTEKFNTLNTILHLITKNNEEKYQPKKEVTLDVILSFNKENNDKMVNYRISINGINKINEYMKMLHQNKSNLIFSVLCSFYQDKSNNNNEINLIKKIKNVGDYITIGDYFMRIKMDTEDEATKEELKKLSKINEYYKIEDYDIFFRYKDRMSYFIKDKENIFRIDLTKVKKSYNINKLENVNYSYEIEIECIINDKKTLLNQLLKKCEFVIKSIQGTDNIVSKSESKYVIEQYRKIIGVNESVNNLYGRQPISLEIQNLSLLQNRYSITDKADGERNFLIIVNEKCYLISSNLIVKNIGLHAKKELNGTIVDGEYIFIKKYNKFLFMAFDCLFIGEKDLRNETKFFERINKIDEFLAKELNKNAFTSYNIKSGEKIIDINNILKSHTENLELFYKTLTKSLKDANNKVIFQRKYFMSCDGLSDNEIFKYMNLYWNYYIENTDGHIPYLYDGLIAQPLEQKYIVDKNLSKFPEYKFKPGNLNSIDLYLEFEKNSITKDIQLVYDNSVKGIIKNKPYVIGNLYVGNVTKNFEKPVQFKVNSRPAQAYIYVNDDNIPRSIDGKALHDKTVVEFYYYTKEELKEEFKWIPIKTRYDKTDSVNKYKKKYGNNEYVAQSVMRSILNPVLMSEIKELSDDKLYQNTFEKIKGRIGQDIVAQEKATDIYYQKKAGLVKDMGYFHHYIKSQLMYTYFTALYTGKQLKILDIGTGRGGDIHKFYYVLAKLVVGIDPDAESLKYSATRSAEASYKRLKETKPNVPPMYFIHADAGLLLKYEDQVKITGQLNDNNKILMEKYLDFNNPKIIFDRLDCQFAIHYLLKNKDTWKNFQENINKFLREGGYFVFTTFDGDIVKNKLSENGGRLTEYYEENGEKKILYDIVQKFNDNDPSETGNTIDVHMGWIFDDGVYYPEYLVYKDFITKSFKENCDMDLVETGLFEDMYENNKEFIKMSSTYDQDIKRIKFFKNVSRFYENNEYNLKCRKYSFLNRYYVFKKREKDLKEVREKYYSDTTNKATPKIVADVRKSIKSSGQNNFGGKFKKK